MTRYRLIDATTAAHMSARGSQQPSDELPVDTVDDLLGSIALDEPFRVADDGEFDSVAHPVIRLVAVDEVRDYGLAQRAQVVLYPSALTKSSTSAPQPAYTDQLVVRATVLCPKFSDSTRSRHV
jgi:hypothetical protein